MKFYELWSTRVVIDPPKWTFFGRLYSVPSAHTAPSNFYTPYNPLNCICSRTWGAGLKLGFRCVIFLISWVELQPACAMLCGSAGVMYWSDRYYRRIEAANTDGSGRREILAENSASYYAFATHAGIIYYASWTPPYVCLLSPAPICVKGASSNDDVCLSVCLSVCLQSRKCQACMKTTKPNNVKI